MALGEAGRAADLMRVTEVKRRCTMMLTQMGY